MNRTQYRSASGVVYTIRGSSTLGYSIWIIDIDGFKSALLGGRVRSEDAQNDLDTYAREYGWTPVEEKQ